MNQQESVEARVIRTLGVELAQARVDLAFARGHLDVVAEAIAAVRTATLHQADNFEPPPGYMIVPRDTMLTLQSLFA